MTQQEQPKEYIRPSVMQFAIAMEDTLRKHDGSKDGWENCGFGWLIERAQQELDEADRDYDNNSGYHVSTALEMIDVANFCMMFYDNASKLYPELIRSHPHTPAAPERVMLCFGDYLECPIDEEECKVSDICHQRAIQNRELAATIRNQTLDAIMDCAETDGEWFRIDGTDTLYLNYSVLSKKAESLRHQSTSTQGGEHP